MIKKHSEESNKKSPTEMTNKEVPLEDNKNS